MYSSTIDIDIVRELKEVLSFTMTTFSLITYNPDCNTLIVGPPPYKESKNVYIYLFTNT